MLDEMEEAVRDACDNVSEDATLALIVEITKRSIITERPLFDNPLTEPLFYVRYILPWVRSQMENSDVMNTLHRAAVKNAF